MQFTFSKDSRTKKQPPVPPSHEPPKPIQQEIAPGPRTEKTVEDLVRRGREIKGRVLACGVQRTSKTHGAVGGNHSVISEQQVRLTSPYRAFADSSPVLDRRLDEHNGALKVATVQESPVPFATTGQMTTNYDYENCRGVYAGFLANELSPTAHIMDRRSRKVLWAWLWLWAA